MLDGLTSLVEQSLLREEDGPEGEPRFVMLATIREFALEQLTTRGELASIGARHTAAFHALALQAEARIFSAEWERWAATILAELDNLRAVFQRALEGDEVETALDTASALSVWFFSSGSLQEGRRWLKALLATPAAATPTPGRARALAALGRLAWAQDDYTTALPASSESVNLWRGLGEPERLALALSGLASTLAPNDAPAAQAAAEEALLLAREAGTPWPIAVALNATGIAATQRGEWDAARAVFQEAVDFAGRYGAVQFRIAMLMNLAVVESRAGNFEAAVAGYEEGLALLRAADAASTRWLAARMFVNLGEARAFLRDAARAAVAYREGLERGVQIGSLGDALRAVRGFGRVAYLERDWRRAAVLFGAADGLRQAHNLQDPRSGPLMERIERENAEIRAALGDAAFDAAYAEGRALTFDAAVALALAQSEPV